MQGALVEARCRRERCATHGATHDGRHRHCRTVRVLAEVGEERARQYARYGTNESTEYGMGPETRWLLPYTTESAWEIETDLRADYEGYEDEAPVTWVHLIREEVAELFAEGDRDAARAEALQVAALCVSMVENMDHEAGRL